MWTPEPSSAACGPRIRPGVKTKLPASWPNSVITYLREPSPSTGQRGCLAGAGQKWSTFVRNHLSQTWAVDWFTIVTLRFQVLYAFVILDLGRREIVRWE